MCKNCEVRESWAIIMILMLLYECSEKAGSVDFLLILNSCNIGVGELLFGFRIRGQIEMCDLKSNKQMTHFGLWVLTMYFVEREGYASHLRSGFHLLDSNIKPPDSTIF